MSSASLVGHTVWLGETYTGGDLTSVVAECARVSNPTGVRKSSNEKLLKYLIKHKHWSPLEMANVVLDISTTRDIARQLLRHRSFSLQEFSQRYSAVEKNTATRECRLQDPNNRQNSLECDYEAIKTWWEEVQSASIRVGFETYNAALAKGIAKEQARVLLAEGLTTTRLFVNGSLRSWLHYIEVRTAVESQKAHRILALQCAKAMEPVFPDIMNFVQGDISYEAS